MRDNQPRDDRNRWSAGFKTAALGAMAAALMLCVSWIVPNAAVTMTAGAPAQEAMLLLADQVPDFVVSPNGTYMTVGLVFLCV